MAAAGEKPRQQYTLYRGEAFFPPGTICTSGSDSGSLYRHDFDITRWPGKA